MAFESLSQVAEFINENPKDSVVLFDFDGTLSNFVSKPMEAYPEKAAKQALIDLVGAGVRVCIVTGRPKEAIDYLLGDELLNQIDVVGEHGATYFDSAIQDTVELLELDSDAKGALDFARESIKEAAESLLKVELGDNKIVLAAYEIIFEDLYPEEKTFSVSLHSRSVKEKLEASGLSSDTVENVIKALETEYELILNNAKTELPDIFIVENPSDMTWEIKPKFNKGDAVTALLAMDQYKDNELVFFAGDSMPGTDAPAADVVFELGDKGVVCHVLTSKDVKYGNAHFESDDPSAFSKEFMSQLADTGKEVQDNKNPSSFMFPAGEGYKPRFDQTDNDVKENHLSPHVSSSTGFF